MHKECLCALHLCAEPVAFLQSEAATQFGQECLKIVQQRTFEIRLEELARF